jgi:hypothetical protein
MKLYDFLFKTVFSKKVNLKKLCNFSFKAFCINNNKIINIFLMEKISETENSNVKNNNCMEVDSDADSVFVDDSGEQNRKKDTKHEDNLPKESKKVVKEFDKDKRIRTDDKYAETEEKEENRDKLKLPKRKYAIIFGYLGHKYSGNQK